MRTHAFDLTPENLENIDNLDTIGFQKDATILLHRVIIHSLAYKTIKQLIYQRIMDNKEVLPLKFFREQYIKELGKSGRLIQIIFLRS